LLTLIVTAIAASAAEKTLGLLVDKVHDKVLDEAAARIVGAVVQSQAEQLALLRGIDRNVEAILQGDFRAGLIFIESAARPQRSPEERIDLLGKARDRFFDALGKEGDNPPRAALIWLQLGITYVALDAWLDAEEALERATLAGLAASPGLVRRTLTGSKSDVGKVLPLLSQIREARIALGAAPRSVPMFVPSRAGAQWPLAVGGASPEESFLLTLPPWKPLVAYPTALLASVVDGSSPGPESAEAASIVIAACGPFWAFLDDNAVGRGVAREVAAKYLAERRRGWPPRHAMNRQD